MYKGKIIFFCCFEQVLGFACGTCSLEENNFPSLWKGLGFACGSFCGNSQLSRPRKLNGKISIQSIRLGIGEQ
jgi:hypothetical protein